MTFAIGMQLSCCPSDSQPIGDQLILVECEYIDERRMFTNFKNHQWKVVAKNNKNLLGIIRNGSWSVWPIWLVYCTNLGAISKQNQAKQRWKTSLLCNDAFQPVLAIISVNWKSGTKRHTLGKVIFSSGIKVLLQCNLWNWAGRNII